MKFFPHHHSSGQLCDGRGVHLVSCYMPLKDLKLTLPNNVAPKKFVSKKNFDQAPDEFRAYVVADIEDGSLGFVDLRAEKAQKQKTL